MFKVNPDYVTFEIFLQILFLKNQSDYHVIITFINVTLTLLLSGVKHALPLSWYLNQKANIVSFKDYKFWAYSAMNLKNHSCHIISFKNQNKSVKLGWFILILIPCIAKLRGLGIYGLFSTYIKKMDCVVSEIGYEIIKIDIATIPC